MLMRVKKSDPRRNASSVEQSRDHKVWSDIKSNVLDNSTDEDKYQKGTGQREAMKYLRDRQSNLHVEGRDERRKIV